MKFCTYCGSHINNQNAHFCENCGAVLNNNNNKNNNYPTNNDSIDPLFKDEYAFLWGILGFFVPIAGLVLFVVWNKEKKKVAKSAGIGALIRVILMVIVFVIAVFLFIIAEPTTERDRDYNRPYEYNERYEDDNWA